ncbi:DUF7289 family protein [Salinibaculum rarum]|uniref:DUF7289 family protein n=1 Tax=Salinibaculum rarum TaxID=3058903 RepID=UPI00265E26D5|nr:hypothetical protein [Salinibaculum sp. KK48]
MIGVALVFGFVIVGSVLIVALGATALGDAQENLNNDRAEKVLTQFDSKAALVALGNTDTQRVAIPGSTGGAYTLKKDTGWMNVSYVNASGGSKLIFNETMGALIYTSGERTIAYQGGGVWRASEGGNSIMVSPPEFHYRDRTLTLPLITVRGDGSLNDEAVITHNETAQHFPDQSQKEFINPVNGTKVNVTVKSKYYRGWGSYFVERTEGDVTYNHEEQTVTISLVPPFEEEYENAVATTDPDGIETNGAGDEPTPNTEGVSYPSLDDRIEDRIDKCKNNASACNSLSSSITSSGTFWIDGDYSSDITVDDPDGNVSIVVNGDYEPGTVTIEDVDDPHTVTAYARENFEPQAYNDVNGNPSEASVIIHSDGEFTISGSSSFTGLIYAPRSDCTINGSPNITGGLVCQTYTDNGKPATDFNYSSDVNDIRLDVQSDEITRLQYLHVTTNIITVSDE